MITSIRIAVVGAGPTGLLFLHRLEQLKKNNDLTDFNWEVKCFEKSNSFGGMWKYDEKVGDERHASMYDQMWTNSPKETVELPTYTFQEHFKVKKMGSMFPRVVMLDYIRGLVENSNLEKYILYNHSVEQVKFDTVSDKFSVQVKDNIGKLDDSTFDFVVVGSGHYSTPNYVPEVIEVLKTFTGKIVHSHNFRRASDYNGDRVLLVGSMFSGEDIALQLMKSKAAKCVTLCYHRYPTNNFWPDGITEKQVFTSCNEKTMTFPDGSTDEFDVVIMATGYLHTYKFLDDELRLKCPNLFYTPLYNGTVSTACPKLFYVGSQNLIYSFTMFELQAAFAWEVIMKRATLPSKKEMEESIAKWSQKEKNLKSAGEMFDFQTSYLREMMSTLGDNYPHDVACPEIFHSWETIRKSKSLETYRDYTFTSIFTNITSAEPKTPWFYNHDDSFEGYFENYN